MDVTHGFMAWRHWVIRLPRVKRCLFRMLQPSGTCLSSPPWSPHPWRLTLHWLRRSFRAHSKTHYSGFCICMCAAMFIRTIMFQFLSHWVKYSDLCSPSEHRTLLRCFSPRKALRHMPPLSLTPSSTEFPKFFSLNILEEVDGFLLRIAE